MGLFSSLLKRFDSQVETGDYNADNRLKTRYYKSDFRKVLNEVEEVLNSKGVRVESVSTEHGELSAIVKSPIVAFLVVSVITVRPFETAIDFTMSTEKKKLTGNYNTLANYIHTIYEELDRKLSVVKK